MRNKVISEYINEKSSEAISSFDKKEHIIKQNIQLFTKWGKNGLISLSDTGNIDRAFIPLLEDAKDIYAITLFENTGNEYEIKRADDVYISRFYSIAKKGKDNAYRWKKIDTSGTVIGSWNGSVDYNPVNADWLKRMSADTSSIEWYGPYFSKTLKQNVISISSSWNRKGKIQYVVLHVLLNDVFGFINNIKLDDNEYMFLLNRVGDIYTFTGNKEQVNRQAMGNLTIPYYKSKVPEISKSVNVWHNNNKNTQTTLQFKTGKNSYWSKFEYMNKDQKKYILAIIVPEGRFSIKFGSGKFAIISWSLLVFAAGIIFALILWIRYNRQLRQVPNPKINISLFEKDVTQLANMPESKTLEFKSTIRFNLHAEKNDKAIEQAWLKGVAAFLNTDGGVLLLGVSDDGAFHGIEKDNFDNLDKAALHIKNLISKYIGVEYMKFVNIYTGTINNKQLVALSCKQSTKPAYLYVLNEEQFYIRIGPSSTKLTTSQAVEHIVNHKFKQVVPF
jgi:hypothetical protein